MRSGSCCAAALGIALAACSSPSAAPEVQQTGAALSVDYFGDTDVIGFHFELTQVSCEGEPVEGLTTSFEVDLVDGIFPGNISLIEQTFDPASRHLGADLFVSLPEGCYDVLAVPASSLSSGGDAFTPSEDCSKATAEGIEVVDGQTEEVTLLSQCVGDPIGALDVLVLLNHPPVISLEIDEKFNYECEAVVACATYFDPDDDPMEVVWSPTTGSGIFSFEVHTHVTGFEEGHRVWQSCATIVTDLTKSYDFTVAIYDLGYKDGLLERIESLVAPETSNDSLTFPVHTNWIEEPMCFDQGGRLVPAEGSEVVRVNGCTYTDAETYYCSGAYPVDPAVLPYLCDAHGLVEAALYPPCPDVEMACGNGVVEGTEACDDGNVLGGDGCSPDCALPKVVDLANAGATLLGEEAGDLAGWSVADAGDVNGDGFGDVIVGAYGYDEGLRSSAGAAYLVLGPVLGTIDLSTAEATLVGEERGDQAGWAVAGAGDVNADGFDDLIIGARLNDEGGTDAGAAYIVLGPVTGTVDLGAAAAKLVGEVTNDLFGASVDGIGDINGDGYDDVIVGAYLSDEQGVGNVGAAYVFHGPLSGTLDASTADAKILGEAGGDYLGFSVGAAGDVNGDGVLDLVLGAYLNDEGSTNAGAAYLVHGPVAGTVDLATDADAKLLGEEAGDVAGYSVAGAGDVNGDGFDDLLVGAPGADSGGLINSGVAYLVQGPIAGTVDLSAADAIVRGNASFDNVGLSVSGAGDVNGDGLADILVGAQGAGTGGETYLILGEPAGVVDPLNADATLFGALGDRAGFSVSTAGDVDGDGLDDLIVGAYGNDLGGNNAGAAYIVYGGSL